MDAWMVAAALLLCGVGLLVIYRRMQTHPPRKRYVLATVALAILAVAALG